MHINKVTGTWAAKYLAQSTSQHNLMSQWGHQFCAEQYSEYSSYWGEQSFAQRESSWRQHEATVFFALTTTAAMRPRLWPSLGLHTRRRPWFDACMCDEALLALRPTVPTQTLTDLRVFVIFLQPSELANQNQNERKTRLWWRLCHSPRSIHMQHSKYNLKQLFTKASGLFLCLHKIKLQVKCEQRMSLHKIKEK